jgi:hypothetical protein
MDMRREWDMDLNMELDMDTDMNLDLDLDLAEGSGAAKDPGCQRKAHQIRI